MKKIRLFAALAAVTLIATACGSTSTEDKLVTLLAETICVADQAYKSIEDLRISGSGAQMAQQKMQEAATKLTTLREQNFSSEADLQAAQETISDKKLFTEKAIALAKTKCSPSDTTIEQVTSDINS